MNTIGCCGDPTCNQNREQKMVRIKDCDEHGRGGVWCDPCIAPLVEALNNAGLRTVASCCGHGHRPGVISLADGRELLILPDLETFHRVNALFPVDINGEVRTAAVDLRERLLRRAERPYENVRDISGLADDLREAADALAVKAVPRQQPPPPPPPPPKRIIREDAPGWRSILNTFFPKRRA